MVKEKIMKTQTQAGITYELPKVVLLQETGIGTSDIAARSCYDSFDKSENYSIQNFNNNLDEFLERTDDYENEEDGILKQQKQMQLTPSKTGLKSAINIDHSDLLDQLAWTHFHHSILEHANLTYLIRGISRGVLQEHARHRIQAISVRSTRYTMSPIINAFTACITTQPDFSSAKAEFIKIVSQIDFLVTKDFSYNKLEYKSIFDKLRYQWLSLSREEFLDLAVAKSSRHLFNGFMPTSELYDALQAGKAKRNCADNFKHIVSDNFKVDLVVTFNLRSLKNYIELRSSNSAWFQIHWLSDEMVKATPRKYLDLIVKQDKLNKILDKKENDE